jgi:hypothetical protein
MSRPHGLTKGARRMNTNVRFAMHGQRALALVTGS